MTFPSSINNFYNSQYIDNQETFDFGDNTHAKKVILYDSSGNPLNPASSSSIGDGRTTVTVAGTALQLSAASVPCKSVTISAFRANTGFIGVGNSTVVAASGTERGVILAALDTIKLFVTNLNLVYLDSTVSGEGVSYVYEV